MKRRRATLFLILWCCTVFSSTVHGADRPVVFVSVVPQKFFVQSIAEDLVDVQVMVKPGANPATYEPRPSQMAKLAGTVLYFAIGVPFEKAWLEKISAINPEMSIVSTDRNIKKMAMTKYRHGTPTKNIVSTHHHGILDPHIWLSPPLVKEQAKVMLAALHSILPDKRDILEKNFKRFVAELTEIDLELKKDFEDKQGLQFMVFHPSWGYFARDYGLKQIAVEMEGKSPKFAQLQELIHHARENDIHILFVQPQFSTKKAKIIAREIHGNVEVADPLAEDWFKNLREVSAKIKSAVK